MHLPVTGSHGEPSSQSHTPTQPWPYLPGSHTENAVRDVIQRLKLFLLFGVNKQFWLTSVAAGSMMSWRTDAVARHGVTGGAVHAVTLQLTQRTVETRRADWRGGQSKDISLMAFALHWKQLQTQTEHTCTCFVWYFKFVWICASFGETH